MIHLNEVQERYKKKKKKNQGHFPLIRVQPTHTVVTEILL